MNAVSRTNAMWSPLADELRREAQRAGHLARSALGAPGAGVFLLVAVALGVAYPLYTGHIWEDFLISFRHAANLAEGHGLVYNLGERVQGFSSPIGVLLASFFHFITGRGSYGPALWLYRIAGILAFALAGVCLLHLTRRHERALQLAPFCFVVLFLLDFKALAFSTNGMETAWMLFFLALSLYALCADTDVNWVMGGLGWAGLMWTRPDSCVYIAVLGVGSLIFRRTTARRHLSALVKMAGVCTVLYLPWFVGAWIYYGSPIPQTVVAKSSMLPGLPLAHLPGILDARFHMAFGPVYAGFGGWPEWPLGALRPLGWFCAFYWLFPSRDRLGRLCSFFFLGATVYLSLVVGYPWYWPPVAMLGWVVLSTGSFTVLHRIAGDGRTALARALGVIGVAYIAAVLAYVWIASAQQMKIQQQEIEFGVRRQVGLWLRDAVQEGERVYLEPVGYIGYFSNAAILDFPGLVSPEVTALKETENAGFKEVAQRLRPAWLVLRPDEARLLFADSPDLGAAYQLAEVFSARARLDSYEYIPGRGYLELDAEFEIYRRRN